MGTEGVQAGGNGPNMKIMNPFHSRHADYGLSDLFGSPSVDDGNRSTDRLAAAMIADHAEIVRVPNLHIAAGLEQMHHEAMQDLAHSLGPN